MFNSISQLEMATPLVLLSAAGRPSYFGRIFGPWLDLGGEPAPIGPNPDDKPKFSFKSLRLKSREVINV